MNQQTEMLKGVLEGLVLAIIGRQQTYGYEITQQLNAAGFTDVVEGTVYTILLRLEKNGWVTIEKLPSTKGPMRKFYTLNATGRQELADFWVRWAAMAGKVDQLKGGR